MPNIDLSILNQRQTPAFFADTLANRPAAGFLGRIFVSTDTFAFYRDNGTGWDLIGGPGTGTITGTGASGQIALWNGASTITGDTGLTYDGTANSLTADKFIVSGGTSSQFLKANGSVDSNSYVPYTGANASLNMGANNLLGQNYFINGNDVNSGGFLGIKQFNGSSSGSNGYTSISALQQNSLYFQFSQTNGTNKTFELSTGLLGTTIRQFLLPDADGTFALTSNIPSVSGAASQVAFFSGTNAITGENNLWWDSVNNHFGINTNVPGTALDVHHDQSTLVQLNQTTATNDTRIGFQNNGTALWRIGNFYNAGANDWGIFDVVGAAQPFTIKKTTGQTFIGAETTSSGRLVVNNTTGDNHIVVIGATAPSIRVRNAGLSPTRQFGLGLATTTNNFIQGTTGGEFCIFNSSTTASPILFGITNGAVVDEVARFSSSYNLLIGTTTDNGSKLQVNGSATFSSSSINQLNLSGGSTISSRILIARGTDDTNQFSTIGWNSFNVYRSNVSISGNQTDFSINQIGSDGTRTPFYINVLGNIGIGTTSPTEKLQISGTGNNYISVASTNSADAGIKMNSVGNREFGILSDGNLRFYDFTSSADRMRIVGSTGNILIGSTTDTGQKLQVNGNALFSSNITITNNARPYFIALTTNTGEEAGIKIQQSGVSDWYIGVSQGTASPQDLSIRDVYNSRILATFKANGVINFTNVPTSAAGLVSGDIYRTANVLNIVP